MIKPYTDQRDNKEKGFTLFISIIITATLLLVSTAIITIAVREAFLTAAGRDSQDAFYAADSGIECALYWDVKNPPGYSAFSTSSASTIFCNQNTPVSVGGQGYTPTPFTLTFLPNQFCSKVTVTKDPSGGTKIESLGYNTCDASNPRRVERAVRVTY
jgi:Tfp pilus assembly protein PilX